MPAIVVKVVLMRPFAPAKGAGRFGESRSFVSPVETGVPPAVSGIYLGLLLVLGVGNGAACCANDG